MKTNQIHVLNAFSLLMLIDKFGSAIEYLLDKMVELEECIKNVEIVKIKFDEDFIENGEKILGNVC